MNLRVWLFMSDKERTSRAFRHHWHAPLALIRAGLRGLGAEVLDVTRIDEIDFHLGHPSATSMPEDLVLGHFGCAMADGVGALGPGGSVLLFSRSTFRDAMTVWATEPWATKPVFGRAGADIPIVFMPQLSVTLPWRLGCLGLPLPAQRALAEDLMRQSPLYYTWRDAWNELEGEAATSDGGRLDECRIWTEPSIRPLLQYILGSQVPVFQGESASASSARRLYLALEHLSPTVVDPVSSLMHLIWHDLLANLIAELLPNARKEALQEFEFWQADPTAVPEVYRALERVLLQCEKLARSKARNARQEPGMAAAAGFVQRLRPVHSSWSRDAASKAIEHSLWVVDAEARLLQRTLKDAAG